MFVPPVTPFPNILYAFDLLELDGEDLNLRPTPSPSGGGELVSGYRHAAPLPGGVRGGFSWRQAGSLRYADLPIADLLAFNSRQRLVGW